MSRRKKDKIRWTDEMVRDLLNCKQDAISVTKSETPPTKPDGNRMGYMQYMNKLWVERGYGHLNLTPQTLSDQARREESKQTELVRNISQTVDEDHNVIIREDVAVYTANANLITSEIVINVDDNLLNDEKFKSIIQEAESIYKAISVPIGDFSKRTFTTKLRTTPEVKEIHYINKAVEHLIQLKDVASITDMHLVLWYINCIVYSVISGWIKTSGIKGLERKKVNKRNKTFRVKVPACVQEVEDEIKTVRALLSKTSAELNRIQKNGRLTRKTKRNRIEISKSCGNISNYSLVCYMQKLKRRLIYLSKKRKRKIKSEKAHKLNEQFEKEQKVIFEKFKRCIEEDEENMKPVFEEKVSERRFFDDPKLVEFFWRNLWEKVDSGNPEADWLRKIQEKFGELVPTIYEGDLKITDECAWGSIRKKKNWSSPGPDKITNFWWKKLKSVLSVCSKTFDKILNDQNDFQQWTCVGLVALLPKPGEWSESNQRPITCLNTMYKWFTSILRLFHKDHLKKHGLLQIDQRGTKENASGTVSNLLIDDVILRDARKHFRNLFCYWIDVRKAFDSVSHGWLVKMLEVHRFPKKLVNVFKKIINNWTVRISIPVKDGFVESNDICLTNGILQGDSYCPDLYVLTMNVISWMLRASDGYKLSAPISTKITHTLYIDDLKGYTKSFQKLKQILNILQKYMKDAGLIWNSKKCKFMALQRGKYAACDNFILDDGSVMKCLPEDENYEFMGVPQRVKMDDTELANTLLKTIQQRSHIVWSSQLSDINKCIASNIFINSSVEYYFWAVKFPINTVKAMDAAIRLSMNVNGGKHTNLMNSINYLPRNQGGRGLRCLEDTYKATKTKIAIKLVEDTDKRMQIVKEFHRLSEGTSSFSIFKDAKRYLLEIGLELEIGESSVTLIECETEEVIANNSLSFSKYFKSKMNKLRFNELISSTWQGVNLAQRINDEEVIKTYFHWLSKWKSCPTDVVNEVLLLFYQLLPTKQYKITRSNEVITDTRCRMCRKWNEESVKHLISNCEDFVHSLYISRHNNALKCFVWPMLKLLGLTDKCPTWYAPDIVAPHYQNDNIEFWWDIPEYTGRDDEKDQPPRPDGKLKINTESEKKIFLLEITIPWTENRSEKYEFKCNKYRNILQNLQFENPEFEIDQITLVMDVFGGYDEHLVNNVKKVFNSKKEINSVIFNMQKSVISSCANLSRTFKVRSKFEG